MREILLRGDCDAEKLRNEICGADNEITVDHINRTLGQMITDGMIKLQGRELTTLAKPPDPVTVETSFSADDNVDDDASMDDDYYGDGESDADLVQDDTNSDDGRSIENDIADVQDTTEDEKAEDGKKKAGKKKDKK